MYFKLNKRYELRGWKLLPFAVCDRDTGRISFLGKDEFKLLYHCDGLHDLSKEEYTDDTRKFLDIVINQGIISECMMGDTLKKSQEYIQYDSRFIKTVQWSITGKCNFRCRHCFMSASHAKLGELSHEQCVKIIDEIANCGIRSVSLTGGEPLVRKDFFELVDELVNHNIRIDSIYSNGKLITNDFFDKIEARGVHPVIHMSFDGVGWHDWLRGISGAEKMTLDAYKLCQKRGYVTTAEMCIHKNNLHTFRETMHLLANLGCCSLKINPAAPMGEWSVTSKKFTLSPKEVNDMFLEYIEQFFEDGMPIGLWLGAFFECDKGSTNYKIGYCKSPSNVDCSKKSVCAHARNSLYISPEGFALPCMAMANTGMRNDFPNMLQTHLKDILSDSVYMKIIDIRLEDYLAHNKKCSECKYKNMCCAGCRGLAVGEKGTDYLAIDEDACYFFNAGYLDKVKSIADHAISKIKV